MIWGARPVLARLRRAVLLRCPPDPRRAARQSLAALSPSLGPLPARAGCAAEASRGSAEPRGARFASGVGGGALGGGDVSRGGRLGGRILDAVAAHLVVDARAVDAEPLGRFALVAAR